MKTSTFLAVSLLSLSSAVLSAPTPPSGNVLGSITNPSAGNNNVFQGNGGGNGNHDGNGNSAGNNDGNGNIAGSGNEAGDGNIVNLKDRHLGSSPSNIVGSITNPSAGNDNVFQGNGEGNGNNDGNGNIAGSDDGNNNKAGNGNSAGNGNTVNVSPDVSPSIALPDITLPNVNL